MDFMFIFPTTIAFKIAHKATSTIFHLKNVNFAMKVVLLVQEVHFMTAILATIILMLQTLVIIKLLIKQFVLLLVQRANLLALIIYIFANFVLHNVKLVRQLLIIVYKFKVVIKAFIILMKLIVVWQNVLMVTSLILFLDTARHAYQDASYAMGLLMINVLYVVLILVMLQIFFIR